jgi:hypothetical protein
MQILKALYRVYKKKATSEFPKKSTLVLMQEILGAWEFKIAQLSKLLHMRVHKAKFMHLFNDTYNKFLFYKYNTTTVI